MDAPVGPWGTQTFIAGPTADAMIAPWVIKGAMDGPAFAAYVGQGRIPEPVPGTVVIPDSLATHKNAAAANAMPGAGCGFLFRPPHSPDRNPIEMAFSKLKPHPRWIGARIFADMFDAVAEICDLSSPQNCWNDVKAAGYVSSSWRNALGVARIRIVGAVPLGHHHAERVGHDLGLGATGHAADPHAAAHAPPHAGHPGPAQGGL